MNITNQKLEKGQFVNHYRIISRLGAGGMGEVYLAEDTLLGRKVALKLLSVESQKNQDFLRRFKQEARATSALNHPNIITIYQIGEWENANYIAMEFVEGNNLRSIMRVKDLKLSTIIDTTAQTASALSAAHAAGIVHRDIKPENIMVRPDGIVKVLDFGLAKNLTEASSPEPEVDNEAATREYLSTIPGLVMGTAQYMSPEQARGFDVDARSDIWSLGVCLYEMVAGVPPFVGDTKTDLLASILKTDPLPLSHYVPDVPNELQHIITKALGKDLDERYQVIKDLLLDMKILQTHLSAPVRVLDSSQISAVREQRDTASTKAENPVKTESIVPQQKSLFYLPLILLILLVGAAGIWYLRHKPEAANTTPLVSEQLQGWKSEIGERPSGQARFSPDGKFIAYVASKDGSNAIWLKQLDEGEAFTKKEENVEETSPLWSPDSNRLAFYSDRQGQRGIWVMPAFGGSLTLLAPTEGAVRLVKWTKDGSTIFFDAKQNLYSLNVAAKQISQLTKYDESQLSNRDFDVSPDNQKIAYIDRKDGARDVWIADINGDNPVQITKDAEDDAGAVWHPDGERVLYSSNRNGIYQLFSAFVDGRPPVQILNSDSSVTISDVSGDGTKILYANAKDDADLWSIRLDKENSKESQLTGDLGMEFWHDVSPDGNTLIYQAAQIINSRSSPLSSLIFSQKITDNSRRTKIADSGFEPRWSPDGKQIAFIVREGSKQNIWVRLVAGSDARQITKQGVNFGGYTTLPFNRMQIQDFEWSADSSSIFYFSNGDGNSNLWQSDVKTGEAKRLTNNSDKSLYFMSPVLSRDGKQIVWIATSPDKNTKKTNWDVWHFANSEAKRIYQSNSPIGLVGWSATTRNILIKTIQASPVISTRPTDIEISEISLDDNNLRQITMLKSSYFQNIRLSPDQKSIVFVSRTNANDALQIVNLSGGTLKTLVESSDPRVYFSDVGFSPDGNAVYYGKQSNWQIISMITNFK